jgi:hypothetical protein
MAIVLDGTTGVTFPAGGLGNTAGAAVGTTDTQTLTNKTIQGGALTLATAVASTSGTSIDFTSIPSWVKRITVMFSGVSTNGTSGVAVRLGTSAGIVATGYLGAAAGFSSSSTSVANSTTDFRINSDSAVNVTNGNLVVANLTENTWSASGVFGGSDFPYCRTTGGAVTLSGTLTQVRITTVNGTDTFDAGTINIMYEG